MQPKRLDREGIIRDLKNGEKYTTIADMYKCSLSTVGKIAQVNGLGRMTYGVGGYSEDYKAKFRKEWDATRFAILRKMGYRK